jgi:C1A family cysteine protease
VYKKITHSIVEEHYAFNPFMTTTKHEQDIIQIDPALMNSLLEYVKQYGDDIDLSALVDHLIDLCRYNGVLTMKNYPDIIITFPNDTGAEQIPLANFDSTETNNTYIPTAAPLRDQVDLRNWASPVDDQSKLGSCTANAVVNAYELLDNQYYRGKGVDLSRLFVYYNTRLLEGTVNSDSGGFIHEALKALEDYGVCTEEMWPYDIEKFVVKPTDQCYKNAEKRKIKTYQKIDSIPDLLDALNNNRPVPVGLTIYDNFNDLDFRNSIVSKPLDATAESVGGHALCIVGYDLTRQLLLAKNSFGIDWGDKGYCWIPFDYARENMYDMWVFDLATD